MGEWELVNHKMWLWPTVGRNICISTNVKMCMQMWFSRHRRSMKNDKVQVCSCTSCMIENMCVFLVVICLLSYLRFAPAEDIWEGWTSYLCFSVIISIILNLHQLCFDMKDTSNHASCWGQMCFCISIQLLSKSLFIPGSIQVPETWGKSLLACGFFCWANNIKSMYMVKSHSIYTICVRASIGTHCFILTLKIHAENGLLT